MVVAMAEGDATWSGKRLDLTTYRKARYLDALLRDHETMNLASPGQVVSDAYLTLKVALDEGIKPKRVVYGIAPRDFIDSTMESPVDTECFRYVSRLVPTQEIELFLSQDMVSKMARQIARAVPLSGKTVDIQLKFFESASNWTDSALRNKLAVQTMPLEKRMLLLSTYEPLDMVPGFSHAEVAHRADVDKQYRDNREDYKARYRKPKQEFYDGQLSCLSKLVALCKNNQIKLVVVNMPIRKSNVELLDSRLYAKYISDVSKLVESKGSVYQDLCSFDEYSKQEFRDSVHLNGFGGMKFAKKLAEVLVNNSIISL